MLSNCTVILCWSQCRMPQSLCKLVWQSLIKLNTCLTCLPQLDTYPSKKKNLCSHTHTKKALYTNYYSGLFMSWKQPVCSSSTNKHKYVVKYNSAMTRDELLIHLDQLHMDRSTSYGLYQVENATCKKVYTTSFQICAILKAKQKNRWMSGLRPGTVCLCCLQRIY